MVAETITWFETAELLPDADLTVLLDGPEFDDVMLGWLEGTDADGVLVWNDYGGFSLRIRVTRWAELPGGLRGAR